MLGALLLVEADMIVFQTTALVNFFYITNTSLLLLHDRNNMFRVCIPAPQSCARGLEQTAACMARTPDCKCYNWQYTGMTPPTLDVFAVADPTDYRCIWIQVPPIAANYTFTWGITYNYSYIPSYKQYMFLYGLYSRWSGPLTFAQYVDWMVPLMCDSLALQTIVVPLLDDCQYSFTLMTNAITDPITDLPLNISVASIYADTSKSVLFACLLLLLLGYCIGRLIWQNGDFGQLSADYTPSGAGSIVGRYHSLSASPTTQRPGYIYSR